MKDCTRLYADYMRVLKNNHIAANAQAGCYLAIDDSLKGDVKQYNEALERLDAIEHKTATEAGNDMGAMMVEQFDFVYVDAFNRAQAELRKNQ